MAGQVKNQQQTALSDIAARPLAIATRTPNLFYHATLASASTELGASRSWYIPGK